MGVLSKLALKFFEILNEIHMAAGAGVIGAIILCHHGMRTNNIFKNGAIALIGLGCLGYAVKCEDKMRPSRRRVVVITGCDTGLGYSLARYMAQLGFTVFATFLDLESMGSLQIASTQTGVYRLEMDIRNDASVAGVVQTVNQFLMDNPKHELYSIISNAAVMIFSEFEWQTWSQIHDQIDVNLIGPMRILKGLLPSLRRARGARIILVISHCAHQCLPGLAAYGASKSGLAGFGDSLRVELGKYGVYVVKFIPGSHFGHTAIMRDHPKHVVPMRNAMTEEQRAFYGPYFEKYNAWLSAIALDAPRGPEMVQDKALYESFESALLSRNPKSDYVVQNWRYAFYQTMFKFSPSTSMRDYFVERFMLIPQYRGAESEICDD